MDISLTSHSLAVVIGACVAYVGHERISDTIGFLIPKRKAINGGKAGDRTVDFWQKDFRDGVREIQNDTTVPILKQQTEILNQQTQLLTEAVTYLKVLTNRM